MERILPYPNNERLSRSAISWKTGCADRLISRIRKQAEARKDASDASVDAAAGAVVLRGVYEAEYQANYDFRRGAGAYQRALAANAEWEAGQAERDRVAKEEAEKAEQEWLTYLQSETPAMKKTREREEAKHRSWAAEDRREARRVDSDAYTSGARAGDKISLGNQVESAKTKRKEIA